MVRRPAFSQMAPPRLALFCWNSVSEITPPELLLKSAPPLQIARRLPPEAESTSNSGMHHQQEAVQHLARPAMQKCCICIVTVVPVLGSGHFIRPRQVQLQYWAAFRTSLQTPGFCTLQPHACGPASYDISRTACLVPARLAVKVALVISPWKLVCRTPPPLRTAVLFLSVTHSRGMLP